MQINNETLSATSETSARSFTVQFFMEVSMIDCRFRRIQIEFARTDKQQSNSHIEFQLQVLLHSLVERLRPKAVWHRH